MLQDRAARRRTGPARAVAGWRRRPAWAVAAGLVALGWLLTSHPVALYDGVGLPDEPYRYVTPSAGAQPTAPPTPGSVTMGLTAGANSSYLGVVTREVGPQATVGFPRGALQAGGPITVTLTPVASAAKGLRLDGNVYEVTVGPPTVRYTAQAKQAALTLRAPTQVAGEVVHFRAGPDQAWRALPTTRAGNDIWAATPPGAGQYALARTRSPAGGGSGIPIWLVGLAAALLVAVLIVLLARRSAPEPAG